MCRRGVLGRTRNRPTFQPGGSGPSNFTVSSRPGTEFEPGSELSRSVYCCGIVPASDRVSGLRDDVGRAQVADLWVQLVRSCSLDLCTHRPGSGNSRLRTRLGAMEMSLSWIWANLSLF